MRIPFCEEFELFIKDSMYWIETTGEREWDEYGRVFTNLTKLYVLDELGNELDDNDDVYNEIQEHILYSVDFEESLENQWDDEEIPSWLEG